jgi:hypothetical protein
MTPTTTSISGKLHQKIELIEQMTFNVFKGQTLEDAERFVSTYYKEALKLSHKLNMSQKRKGRNKYNGLPIKLLV